MELRNNKIIRSVLSPVTLMFIPHTNSGNLRLKVPAFVLIAFLSFSIVSFAYLINLVDDALHYDSIKGELAFYKDQYSEIESTISSLTVASNELKSLFSLNSREDVLENMHDTDKGSLDRKILSKQIDQTMKTRPEISQFIGSANSLFMATPLGWPVKGSVTSKYGERPHPTEQVSDFHTGIDIAAKPGSNITATSDGIVIFSGRSGSNGNLVAIEHGYGYRTYFGHNKKNLVKVGQTVKRGDVIALLGSTGNTTGPHLHYEIWKDGRSINPQAYLKGGNI